MSRIKNSIKDLFKVAELRYLTWLANVQSVTTIRFNPFDKIVTTYYKHWYVVSQIKSYSVDQKLYKL